MRGTTSPGGLRRNCQSPVSYTHLEGDTGASWRFRYRFGGKQRVMNLGSYAVLSSANARKTAQEMAARVSLGYDVAGEKQERKREAVSYTHLDVYKRQG